MSASTARDKWSLRTPRASDGSKIWALVREVGTLDLNSSYQYIMWSEFFSQSSVIAISDSLIGGFVTGFRPPDEPEALFIWQVGVHPRARGAGLASKMLDFCWSTADRKPTTLLTTVSPSNVASRRLFESFARRQQLSLVEEQGFPASLFPEGADAHEAEPLLRLSPR